MNYQPYPGPDENVDEITQREIQTLKIRVHCLSQELWDCQEYPNRINVLIMLSAAVADLLLLENNQQDRTTAVKQ